AHRRRRAEARVDGRVRRPRALPEQGDPRLPLRHGAPAARLRDAGRPLSRRPAQDRRAHHEALRARRLRGRARGPPARRAGARRVHSRLIREGDGHMGKFGDFVIDADGHGGEPADWQERLPKEFQSHMAARRERIKKQFANLPGVGVKETKGTARVDSLARPGMNDPKSRLEDMDLQGIDTTVMFPGGAGEEWAGLDRGFAVALCRTLNDARAEFCRFAPKRLTSVAKLPMIDPQAAAAELRRAVTELGMVGMVTPQHIREKNLDHESFDVVWAEAERLGVPV